MRILGYCLMPNHWHLVLWPSGDGELSTFMRLLTLTHTQRWHAHHHSAGTGHLYQGRFKSFVVRADAYYLTVCRYVERNAVRANLVERAEDWRWGSLWRRQCGTAVQRSLLSEGPLSRPGDWIERVNEPETPASWKPFGIAWFEGHPTGVHHGSRKLRSVLDLNRPFAQGAAHPGQRRRENSHNRFLQP
jgi:putative transposase